MNAVETVVVGYDADLYEWLRHQARLLKERRLEALDLENLIEEIEDLGSEQLNAAESFVRQILIHLLCLQFSGSSAPQRHWKVEIGNFRIELAKRLKRSPSLRRKIADSFEEEWRNARRLALLKLDGEPARAIPQDCPFTLAQVLDEDFFQEPVR